MKNMIWSSEIKKEDIEWIKKEEPDMTENMALETLYELNETDLECEKDNLQTIHIPNGIICIASLGLWNGTKPAYSENDYKDIPACIGTKTGDAIDTEFYVEDGELVQAEHHHDGTNYYIFRSWKENISDYQKNSARDKLYEIINQSDDMNIMLNALERLTCPVGLKIGEVYGWN